LARPLVLVADHNPFVRKSVREFLTDLEVEVREALSGNELLEVVRGYRPDLIILDAKLPGPGGGSVLEALKSEAGLRHVPVILFEEGNADNPRQAIEGKADEHIEELQKTTFEIVRKPFERSRLVETVTNALNSGRGIVKGKVLEEPSAGCLHGADKAPGLLKKISRDEKLHGVYRQRFRALPGLSP